MDADAVLTGLLVVSLILALLLMGLSLMMLGRKFMDLEYQRAEGINGRRQRQSWMNIRTYGNRVFLGAVFVVVNVLLLADAPQEWRMWINRGLWVLLLASYVRASGKDWTADTANLVETQARLRAERERTRAPAVAVEHDVSTNNVGPAGPAGIQGPVGPQGQVGPAGIQGEHAS